MKKERNIFDTVINIVIVSVIILTVGMVSFGLVNESIDKKRKKEDIQHITEVLDKIYNHIEESELELKQLQNNNRILHLKLNTANTLLSNFIYINNSFNDFQPKHTSLFISDISDWDKIIIPSNWSHHCGVVYSNTSYENQNELWLDIRNELENDYHGFTVIPENHLDRLYELADKGYIILRADLDYQYVQNIYSDCIEKHQFNWPHIIIYSSYSSEENDTICKMIKNFTRTCCISGASIRIIYTDNKVQDFSYYVE